MKVDVNPFLPFLTKIYPLPALNLQMIPWFIKTEKGLPLWGRRSSNKIKAKF